MNKPLRIGIAAALLCCAGCFTGTHEALKVTSAPPPAPLAPPPPPVSADQVTAENRHQMAQALFDELERDANRATVDGAPP